jgi:hypothetical protein
VIGSEGRWKEAKVAALNAQPAPKTPHTPAQPLNTWLLSPFSSAVKGLSNGVQSAGQELSRVRDRTIHATHGSISHIKGVSNDFASMIPGITVLALASPPATRGVVPGSPAPSHGIEAGDPSSAPRQLTKPEYIQQTGAVLSHVRGRLKTETAAAAGKHVDGPANGGGDEGANARGGWLPPSLSPGQGKESGWQPAQTWFTPPRQPIFNLDFGLNFTRPSEPASTPAHGDPEENLAARNGDVGNVSTNGHELPRSIADAKLGQEAHTASDRLAGAGAGAEAAGSFGRKEHGQGREPRVPPPRRLGKPHSLNPNSSEQEDQVTIIVGHNGKPLHVGSW